MNQNALTNSPIAHPPNTLPNPPSVLPNSQPNALLAGAAPPPAVPPNTGQSQPVNYIPQPGNIPQGGHANRVYNFTDQTSPPNHMAAKNYINPATRAFAEPPNETGTQLHDPTSEVNSRGQHGGHQDPVPLSAYPYAPYEFKTETGDGHVGVRTGGVRKVAAPRKRAPTACDTCRSKKIKCDNMRPRCGSCIKGGYTTCNYRVNDTKDYAGFDTASAAIMDKLDLLIRDVQDIKSAPYQQVRAHVAHAQVHAQDEHADLGAEKRTRSALQWDMSLTTLFRWRCFVKTLEVLPREAERTVRRLVAEYNRFVPACVRPQLLLLRLKTACALETLLRTRCSALVNSFFLHCHTKIPVLDMAAFFEQLRVYKLVLAHDPTFEMCAFLEMYLEDIAERPPDVYFDALKTSGVEDTAHLRAALARLCALIPVFVAICALGAIATPVGLDNLAKFKSSLEERDSLAFGVFAEAGVEELGLPLSRVAISYELLQYAQLLGQSYPFALPPSSLRTVVFHLLISQYHMSVMAPLVAYEEITTACHAMMYYLEMRRGLDSENSRDDPDCVDGGDDEADLKQECLDETCTKEVVDRLFWTVLKLECELRVELQPYVAILGITLVEPPLVFPKLADFESLGDYSEGSIRLASTYYDEFLWYYFLTEIAVRKVDNLMFDEMCSMRWREQWDSGEFAEETLWTSLVRYLNQYNGIINSLSPQIRGFVMQEENVEQIYWRLKRKRKPSGSSEEDILDDFLVDDDLLLQNQLELIMYIKMRIVTSKLVLFRPIVYLILEDKIGLADLLGAAVAVFQSQSDVVALASPESLGAYLSSNPDTDVGPAIDYYNLMNADMHYQKKFPDEDFALYMQWKHKTSARRVNEGQTDFDEQNDFTLSSLPEVKARLLRVFIQTLLSTPKLVMPTMGAHRHPGLW